MLRTPTTLPSRCMRKSLTRYPSTSQALMSRWWHDASTALTYQGSQVLRSLGTGVPASPPSQNNFFKLLHTRVRKTKILEVN